MKQQGLACCSAHVRQSHQQGKNKKMSASDVCAVQYGTAACLTGATQDSTYSPSAITHRASTCISERIISPPHASQSATADRSAARLSPRTTTSSNSSRSPDQRHPAAHTSRRVGSASSPSSPQFLKDSPATEKVTNEGATYLFYPPPLSLSQRLLLSEESHVCVLIHICVSHHHTHTLHLCALFFPPTVKEEERERERERH